MSKIMFQNFFFYFLSIVILSPLFAISFAAFSGKSEIFEFLFFTVLDDVLINSAIILVLTGIGVLLIGVLAAWLTVHYSFFGSSILRWALFMPLAFPTYILAYVYTNFFDGAGAFSLYLREWGVDYLLPDVRTTYGASLILTFCLYPYVYLFARNGFLSGSKSQIECASLLGSGKWSQFFIIALPSARPFIVVGLMLVIMEVLSDYGTMDYFSLRVFSTVIYDSWAGYGDINAAARLSILLLFFVFILVFLEKKQRGRMKFYANDKLHDLDAVLKKGHLWMSLFCFLPVFIGFLFPFILMMKMAYMTVGFEQVSATIPYIYNTLSLSFAVVVLSLIFAYFLTSLKRFKPHLYRTFLFNACGFGYAIPGVILGLGILLMSSLFSAFEILVTGTFAFLVLAYLIRFFNVALQGLDAGFDNIPPSINEASVLIQSSKLKNFWYVKMPLLSPAVLSVSLILVVEIIKELPITLILRPFDFDTLAVHTYHLASDERLAEATFPALCIVLAGCVPVLLLNKFSRR